MEVLSTTPGSGRGERSTDPLLCQFTLTPSSHPTGGQETFFGVHRVPCTLRQFMCRGGPYPMPPFQSLLEFWTTHLLGAEVSLSIGGRGDKAV